MKWVICIMGIGLITTTSWILFGKTLPQLEKEKQLKLNQGLENLVMVQVQTIEDKNKALTLLQLKLDRKNALINSGHMAKDKEIADLKEALAESSAHLD